MKEIVKGTSIPVTTYKVVDKKYYISDDGKRESSVKKDVEQYEKQVLLMKTRQAKFDSIMKILPDGLYDDGRFYVKDVNYFKFDNHKDFEWLIDEYYGRHIEGKFPGNFVSGWMSIKMFDGGDYCAETIETEHGKNLIDNLKEQYMIYKVIIEDES